MRGFWSTTRSSWASSRRAACDDREPSSDSPADRPTTRWRSTTTGSRNGRTCSPSTAIYQIVPRENRAARACRRAHAVQQQDMMRDRIKVLREANEYNIHTDRHIVGLPRLTRRTATSSRSELRRLPDRPGRREPPVQRRRVPQPHRLRGQPAAVRGQYRPARHLLRADIAGRPALIVAANLATPPCAQRGRCPAGAEGS